MVFNLKVCQYYHVLVNWVDETSILREEFVKNKTMFEVTKAKNDWKSTSRIWQDFALAVSGKFITNALFFDGVVLRISRIRN